MRKSIIAAASLLAGACGSDKGVADAPAGAATLAAIRSEIFTPSCVFGSCHSGTSPAAKLDLHSDSLCNALVVHTSCLFPTKMLVVPGKPERSFLLDKLRGTGLDDAPAAHCADSNQRMPFGAVPLSADKIGQVEDWIVSGAPCGSDMPVDAAFDAHVDAAPGPPADVISVSASAADLDAGAMAQITVTLEHGAPAGGQTVDIDVSDPTVLGVPSALHVDDGLTSITFDTIAKRPARRTTITARSGATARTVPIRVQGIELSEILYNPVGSNDGLEWIKVANYTNVPIDLSSYTFGSGRTDYTITMAQLTGMIPAHGCFVIGGPTSSAANGNPAFAQKVNFSPDLEDGSGTNGQSTGFGLFDVPITQMTTTSIPIDVVLCGQNNLAGLLGTNNMPATPICADIAAPGHTVLRVSPNKWQDQATPTPNSCTPIHL